MSLPKTWAWLASEPAPRLLVEGLALFGIRETAGPRNTPAIMAWAQEVGPRIQKVYTADSIPWCGLFMAVVAKRAGKSQPESPLWARAWAAWGDPSPRAALGDVLVFVRPGGGHVGIYVGEDKTSYAVLGGNQGDAVSIVWIAKSRCIAVRREYRIGPPPNVRPVTVKRSGALSRNEA
jgi:uncharacterized protein (TIGR02594 family)